MFVPKSEQMVASQALISMGRRGSSIISTDSSVHDAAPASTSIPLRCSLVDWSKNASEELTHEEYIKSAVHVASKAADRFSQFVQGLTPEEEEGSSPSSLQAPLASDNVYVVLAHAGSPVVTDIELRKIKPFSSGLDERSVCVSLGNILLDLFSRGKSSSPNSDGESALLPSAAKRAKTTHATAASSNKSISAAKAKTLLSNLNVPHSICRLVCDLLDTQCNEPSQSGHSSTAITKLQEAKYDISQMKAHPNSFLFDRTSTEGALHDTTLFSNSDGQTLFGRGGEIDTLLKAKRKIEGHTRESKVGASAGGREVGSGFQSEAIFLSGYAGSGKSCLVRTITQACNSDQWFVLSCKFDRQTSPLMLLAKTFDDFFSKWGLSASNINSHDDNKHLQMIDSFHDICRTIFSTVDDDGFAQLSDIIPSFSRMFPLRAMASNQHGQQEDVQGSSSLDNIGCAEKRRVYLFHLLFRAVCSSGRPVLWCFDDLQWSDANVMEGMVEFLTNYIHDISPVHSDSGHRGLMIVGTFRSNECGKESHVMKSINLLKESAGATLLNVSTLTKNDVTELIAAKLCLPRRYVHELAEQVLLKTKGNPFHVTEFLKSIISNTMLEYSVKKSRWEWDCCTIDLQMISKGVAELLTSSFNQLPSNLTKVLKIVAIIGSQIERSTVDLLNEGHTVLSFDIERELELAVREGILEKAGPLFQFTHDLIQSTLFDLIPDTTRKLLHKIVGTKLLNSSEGDQAVHLLAVDQINRFCKDGKLSSEERSRYITANATAAKYAIASSSFEQARGYIHTGIELFEDNHWDEQYALSLDLFNMSAQVSSMCGDISRLPTDLDELITHARTFEDSLSASEMLAQLLASQSDYQAAIANCLDILSRLHETFPPTIDLSVVFTELSTILPALKMLTLDYVKGLPKMTDTTKLNAMKFLGMLCQYSVRAAPFLLPLLSCRMIKLTFESGFCDDTIIGFVMTAYSLVFFTDEVGVAYRIGKVGESLMNESQNVHRLKSRLCHEWEGGVKVLAEPLQAIIATFPSLYESAMLCGDVQGAMQVRWSHSLSSFYAGENITSLSKHFILCISQSKKMHQQPIQDSAMAVYRGPIALSGRLDSDGIKSYAELEQIGKETNNSLLLFHNSMSQICVSFWFRDYVNVVKLCQKFPTSGFKRILHVVRSFYEGIAALQLARKTNESKLRSVGVEALENLSKLALVNIWTWKNKADLLRAELHYVDGNLALADAQYNASIEAAKRHQFQHEEALARELYGIFCCECKMIVKGMEQLNMAVEQYRNWGAFKKADDLQLFIERGSV